MRTVDPEQHRRRRHEIVEAAVGLFASKGFEATTTADICRAAGISTGRLFHYFPSKQAVFHAIFELDRREQEEALVRAVADPDPWRGLTAVVERIAAETAHPVVAGLFVEVVTQAHRDPVVTRLVAEDDRRVLDAVAALVGRLTASGRADPGMPPAEAARWVLTLAESFYGRGYPEPGRDRAADLVTVLELVARVLRLDAAGAPGR
ncbi:TetR/AcrR family transcriptional regulator [Kineococcus auxinigenes]|uniref:TetR/AcrR family transcriptional regulator n=1 Tax=unclassified Kineococcus TaxID=2621656 RepID=UPI003D7C5705